MGGKGCVVKLVTLRTTEAGLPRNSPERLQIHPAEGRGELECLSSNSWWSLGGGRSQEVKTHCSEQCEGKPRGGGAGAGSRLPAECTGRLGRFQQTL